MKKQKKLCKCIKDYYYGNLLVYEKNNSYNCILLKDNIYVEFNDGKSICSLAFIDQPHSRYRTNNNYFPNYFIYLKEERKLKLEKLQKWIPKLEQDL